MWCCDDAGDADDVNAFVVMVQRHDHTCEDVICDIVSYCVILCDIVLMV